MKKIILLLFLLTHTNHTLFSMEVIKRLSPHSSREKIKKTIPDDIQKSLKTNNLTELLRIINRAKNNFNITESDLGNLALSKKNRTIKHQYLFLQMKRIESYNNHIKEEKKLCPATTIHSNFDTIISLYKQYQDARLRANSCGIFISEKQQYAAMPHTDLMNPNIAFEEFLNLEANLTYLRLNQMYFSDMIAMILASEINPDANINLDTDTTATSKI